MSKPYTIEGGKIQNTYCEINVAEHCNLACRSCNHLSPVMPKKYAAPDQVFNDLSALAACYHVHQLKLLGGEPLLHPALNDVIQAVKQSGLADRVVIVTNGTLLPRMARDFWQSVDEVWVSSYPGFELSSEQRALCQKRADESGVRFAVSPYSTFRESHAALGTTDQDLVSRIYSTCHIAHTWGCHTVANGYFYKCPPSYFIPQGLAALSGSAPQRDGIRISSDHSFRDELVNYLESSDPLAACQYCLGTVGRCFPHQQLTRRQWSAPSQYRTEDLVDFSLLEKEEQWFREPHKGNRRLRRAAMKSINLSARAFHRILELARTRGFGRLPENRDPSSGGSGAESTRKPRIS